ncbi:DUF4185 domain-containing protein [Compostibacter hankyongensis]|uniref:DUF4185 domain-containing protein n=1 Tax=Compostibacter hankyongensis TaxID=1007089 RepID=A0ABP8FMC5_9BACT
MKIIILLSALAVPLLTGPACLAHPERQPAQKAVDSLPPRAAARDITSLRFSVTEAPEWTDLFRRTSGWFGADGIFALPLNGADTADASDSLMFVFSDTMIGDIKEGQLQPGHTMVHNSVAYMKGAVPEKENIRFYYDHNKKGRPESLFIPETRNTKPGDYFWLGDGFVNKALHNNIYIFGYRMRNMSSDDWSFRQVANTLIVLPSGSHPPFKQQRQIETPFLTTGPDGQASLGAGILVNTRNAGMPAPDGFVYVYGIKGKQKGLIVARVKPADFEDFGRWRFWDGDSWNADMRNAKTVTSHVSDELSLSPLPDGRYALVFQVDGMSPVIGLRLGLSPHGPFGPLIKIWKCPEPEHKNFFVYNAKAHPALSGPGELLISYNVNAFDFFKTLSRTPDLYRPRFIRVKLR